ncbi:MAG: ABC transporter substrate-binding protein [Deltaproteobacteria bacterium]|nr:MAG: ABC transporter substrate-binding protein [Deltaproteobacteria bacterium]
MRLGRPSFRLAAVALSLALSACKDGGGSGDAGAGSGTQAKGPAKMGAALSMTGAAATYGQSQKNGLEAATEEVNGSNSLQGIKLELLVEDDATSKEQGINVFQRFINTDKVSVIIGPTLSTTATAADPLAQQAKVPVLAISNTSPTGITDIGDYIWRDSLTEAQVVPGAVKKAKAKIGFKSAAVLYGNDDVFTKAGYDVMKKALADENVTVVDTQTFAKPDRDFSAQLTAMKGKKPEILVISALADNAAAIVAQARQLGYAGPILGGNGFNSPGFIKNAGPAAEGVLVGTSWNSASTAPANQRFKELMQKRGANPDQFSAQAYSGVLIVAEAVRKAGYKTGRDDIKGGFAQVKDLDTPLGKFSFTQTRDAQHEPAVQQVKNGKFEIVE